MHFAIFIYIYILHVVLLLRKYDHFMNTMFLLIGSNKYSSSCDISLETTNREIKRFQRASGCPKG